MALRKCSEVILGEYRESAKVSHLARKGPSPPPRRSPPRSLSLSPPSRPPSHLCFLASFPFSFLFSAPLISFQYLLSFTSSPLQKLSITSEDGWYSVTLKDFASNRGWGLLDLYHSSPYEILTATFLNKKFDERKFLKSPKNSWKSDENLREIFTTLESELRIQKEEDWYRVSHAQLLDLGVSYPIWKLGGLAKFLEKFYPGYIWDPKLFSRKSFAVKKSSQKLLAQLLAEILTDNSLMAAPLISPSKEILSDYRNSGIRSNSSNSLELDIYVPCLKLALEFQGQQHYEAVPGVFDAASDVQKVLYPPPPPPPPPSPPLPPLSFFFSSPPLFTN